jgi:excisionase family DNA binding protein
MTAGRIGGWRPAEGALTEKSEVAMSERGEHRALLEEGLLRMKEAASFTQLSVAQLYKLMRDNQLPFVKIGRCRRIPRRALLDLVEKHLVTGP